MCMYEHKIYIGRSVLEQYSVLSYVGQSSCGTATETMGTHEWLMQCVVSRTGAVFGGKQKNKRDNFILKPSARRDFNVGEARVLLKSEYREIEWM